MSAPQKEDRNGCGTVSSPQEFQTYGQVDHRGDHPEQTREEWLQMGRKLAEADSRHLPPSAPKKCPYCGK